MTSLRGVRRSSLLLRKYLNCPFMVSLSIFQEAPSLWWPSRDHAIYGSSLWHSAQSCPTWNGPTTCLQRFTKWTCHLRGLLAKHPVPKARHYLWTTVLTAYALYRHSQPQVRTLLWESTFGIATSWPQTFCIHVHAWKCVCVICIHVVLQSCVQRKLLKCVWLDDVIYRHAYTWKCDLMIPQVDISQWNIQLPDLHYFKWTIMNKHLTLTFPLCMCIFVCPLMINEVEWSCA